MGGAHFLAVITFTCPQLTKEIHGDCAPYMRCVWIMHYRRDSAHGYGSLPPKTFERNQTMPYVQTAPGWNQPAIPLIDIETRKKVKLRLRTMSFRREIGSLPSDMRELHELLVEYRNKEHESTYMMVSVWNKLRIYEDFWKPFKFQNEAEYLAYYGLPDGATLAGWTVMVNLFDKPTFVLLGDAVLSFMMRMIGQHQPDTDARKRDYQEIFDRYCKVHDAFDKATFYDLIRRYITEAYENPRAQEAGMNREQWLRDREMQRREKTHRRVIKDAPNVQTFGPKIAHDFEWQEEQCPYCVSKITTIKAFQEYTRLLEDIIQMKLGPDRLPQRPAALIGL